MVRCLIFSDAVLVLDHRHESCSIYSVHRCAAQVFVCLNCRNDPLLGTAQLDLLQTHCMLAMQKTYQSRTICTRLIL